MLDTLREFEVLLGVLGLPLPLPATAAGAAAAGRVWGKAAVPSAEAGATVLGSRAKPAGTL